MSASTDDDLVIHASGLRVTDGEPLSAGRDVPQTAAHAFRSGRDLPETEAHTMRSGRDLPENDADATLRVGFRPEAQEQTLTITYRPPAFPGDEPEVVLHRAYARSDARLKIDIRAI